MKPLFFGQYLLGKGIINAVQLTKAIELQEESNRELGKIAEEKNMLIKTQVREIIQLQMKEDIYFGEAAIRLGFLTKEKVEELLTEQRVHHIFLGEALIKLGYLTEEIQKRALEDFTKEQAEIVSTSEENFPAELMDVKSYVDEFTLYTMKILQRMGGVISKYGGCRFAKKEVKLSPVSIQLDFNGERSKLIRRYILMMSKAGADIFATKIYRKTGLLIGMQNNSEIIVDDHLVIDVITEMVNVICGQVCCKISSRGELKGSLPRGSFFSDKAHAKHMLGADEKAAVVLLITPYGTLPFSAVFSGS